VAPHKRIAKIQTIIPYSKYGGCFFSILTKPPIFPNNKNMKIQRVKNGDYTVINNDFMLDNKLSLGAIGLLAKIMSLPENWTGLPLDGIDSICKEDSITVCMLMQELKENGYCDIERAIDTKSGNKGAKCTFYATKDRISSIKSEAFFCMGDDCKLLFNQKEN
jgi:hypothetical protein